ncbi:unnamed protein product, partial [Leptidea sinapis]
NEHRIYDCSQFKSKSVDDRITLVNKLNLCTNCLRVVHSSRVCRLSGTCKICKRRHNTLLHKSNESDTDNYNSDPISKSATSSSEVLLCTALVDIINPTTNNKITIRALLDSGSQTYFITESLKEQLNLIPIHSDTQNVIGIVIPQISGKLPKSFIHTTHLNLSSFELADPSFYIPSEIGLLIGADIF